MKSFLQLRYAMSSNEKREFNKRFGIVEMQSPEEEFKNFKNRLLNICRDIDNCVSIETIENYCNELGINIEMARGLVNDYEAVKLAKNIYKSLESEKSEKQLYFKIQLILNLDINTNFGVGSIVFD